MKQRNIFEPQDFKGAGQMVIRNSFPPNGKDGCSAASVAYKVGWLAGKGSKGGLYLISLTDGMIGKNMSVEELCAFLNGDQLGFRPMTQDEIKLATGEVGNRFYP